MGAIRILSGDFYPGKTRLGWSFKGPRIKVFKKEKGKNWFAAHMFRDSVYVSDIAKIKNASEETSKGFLASAFAGLLAGLLLGAIGMALFGIFGALLLGAAGLLGGVLAFGNRKKITFELTLKDGRKMLATAGHKTFLALKAGTFK